MVPERWLMKLECTLQATQVPFWAMGGLYHWFEGAGKGLHINYIGNNEWNSTTNNYIQSMLQYDIIEISDLPDHATFREKSVTTGLVGQA